MKDIEKSGIILEDKNEYSDGSSDDESSSEAKSVSSLQTKEKKRDSVSDDDINDDYLPPPLALLGQKNISECVQMKNNIFKKDNEFIAKALGNLFC
jgi:hypothetical protein